MTIDEAIEKSKELASTYRIAAKNAENIFISKLMQETKRKIYIKLAEEHEQLAEWLEELKSYRASVFSGYMTQKMLKEEYNKAIDDLLGGMNQITYNCQDADELFEKICDLAEQLKAGGMNERSI